MSNLLQYTLSLQDKMSRSLKAIGINSGEALDKFAKLEKQSKDVQKTFNTMGKSIGSLKQKLDLLKSEKEWIPSSNLRSIKAYTREIQKLEREIGKLENKGRGGFLSRMFGGSGISGGGMGGMLMGFGRSLMPLAGAALLTAGLTTTVNAGMSASRNQASFETLSGKEAGGKLFKDVQKFAQESIYGNELYDQALQMRAFGIETEKILPAQKMLGDIAMGNKEKLSSLTLAYSQIMSAQKLQGQDLLQLVNAGFNPLTIIAEKTGIKYGELRKRMEAGAISAEMVTQAFKAATSEGGQFFNMTQKIAETPFGKWEAFKGQLEGIATNIGMKLLPAISKVVDWLSKAADTAYSLGQSVWNDLQPVFESLKPVIEEVGGFLGRIFKISWDIATTIRKTLAPIITSLIKLLEGPLKVALAIVEFAFKALQKVIEAVAWAIDKVRQAFNWVADKLGSPIDSKFREAEKVYQQYGEDAAKAYLRGFSGTMTRGVVSALTTMPVKHGGLKFVNDPAKKIEEAKIPGANPFDFNGALNSSDKSGNRSKSNEAVATGGTKNTTVHITIGKQIESLNVISNNIKEGAEKIRDIIVDEMTRALAMSQAIAE